MVAVNFVPDVGCEEIMQTEASTQFFTVRLYKASYTPDRNTTLANLVPIEADFGGYTPFTFSPPPTVTITSPGATLDYASTLAFTQVTTPNNTIYGCWVQDQAGALIGVKEFAMPYVFNTPGTQLNIGVSILEQDSSEVGPPTPSLLIDDILHDVNGTDLASHTIAPTNVPATSWTHQAGSIQIQSNLAEILSNTPPSYSQYTFNPGKKDGVMTCQNPGHGFGLMCRWVDPLNYVLGYVFSSGLGLYIVTAGVSTLISASFTVVQPVQLEASGDSIRFHGADGFGIELGTTQGASSTIWGVYGDVLNVTGGEVTFTG